MQALRDFADLPRRKGRSGDGICLVSNPQSRDREFKLSQGRSVCFERPFLGPRGG